jgi:acyl transferase domain-containing protein
VHVALDNCHQQTVLYGPRERLDELATALGREGALCAFLPFDRPYHTPLFAPVAEMVEGVYDGMDFRAPKVPLYSCVTASPMPSSPQQIRALAAEQWRTRVRFTETIQQMYADGFRTFVEVGPSANLTGFIENVLQGKDVLAVSLDSRRRSGLTQLLHALGRIWVTGRSLDLAALVADRAIPALDLDADRPKSKARVVANTLPFLHLPASEIELIREALGQGAATSPGAEPKARSTSPKAPEHAPPASQAPAPANVAANAVDEPAAAVDAPGPGVLSGHFSLMQTFLDTQEAVMTAALAGTATPPPHEAEEPYPFLHRVIVQEAGRLVAQCDLHLGQEFVRQHVLYAMEVSELDPGLTSLPVVPMAVSMEILAEAASALMGGVAPRRLEQVSATN